MLYILVSRKHVILHLYKAILIFLNIRKRFQYKFKLTEIYI